MRFVDWPQPPIHPDDLPLVLELLGWPEAIIEAARNGRLRIATPYLTDRGAPGATHHPSKRPPSSENRANRRSPRSWPRACELAMFSTSGVERSLCQSGQSSSGSGRS